MLFHLPIRTSICGSLITSLFTLYYLWVQILIQQTMHRLQYANIRCVPILLEPENGRITRPKETVFEIIMTICDQICLFDQVKLNRLQASFASEVSPDPLECTLATSPPTAPSILYSLRRELMCHHAMINTERTKVTTKYNHTHLETIEAASLPIWKLKNVVLKNACADTKGKSGVQKHIRGNNLLL